MADQEVNFEVEIKQINQVEFLKDDLLVEKLGGHFKSLADLELDIRRSLELERGRQSQSVFEGHLMAKIVQGSTIELPENLLEDEVSKLKQELAEDLKRNQTSLEDWLAETKQTLKQHQTELKQIASNRLKGGLALREIAKQQQITVSDKEVLEAYADLNPATKDEAQAKQTKEDIKARLITQKTLKLISQIATT